MGLNEKSEVWLTHIQAWRKSGMAQVEYCAAYGLNTKTFSNWKTKLNKYLPGLVNKTRDIIIPPAPRNPFLEVSIDDKTDVTEPSVKIQVANNLYVPSTASAIQLHIGTRYSISINENFDLVTLQRLLSALAEQ